MNLVMKERRAVTDLALAMAVGLLLAFLNLALNFSDVLHEFFADYMTVRVAAVIVNVLFFWLVLMLATAYRRWQSESLRRTQLETIISSISPDALIVVSPSRRIEICNDSIKRIFGFKREEVVGKLTDVLYGDRRTNPSRKGEIHDVLEQDGFHIGLATGHHKNGAAVPLEIITGELADGNGAVLLLRDISERVQAEKERQELEARVRQRQKLESLGVLAGGIAHDFNNLLMGIMGNAELLQTTLASDAHARHNVEGIKTAAARAAELCRSLLAYSGRGAFSKEHVDLSALVREMAELLTISISKHAHIEYDLAEALPPVEVDASQIRQIVMNFITNASDACGQKPNVILLRTGVRSIAPGEPVEGAILDTEMPAGDYVFMEVADEGSGMDEQTRSRIFDPFFTTKLTGRGLGLSSVLGIVRSHNASIRVVSRLGEGSVFTVFFNQSAPVPSVPVAPVTYVQQTFKGKVLLVDDEEIIRAVGRELLEYLGFEVETAPHGQAAVDVFKQRAGDFDAVLLDMTMPGMSGEETLDELRRIRPDAVVVLSSGYAREADSLRNAQRRASAFIEKPYQLDVLRRVFNSVLAPSGAPPQQW